MDSLLDEIAHPENYWRTWKTYISYSFWDFEHRKHWFIRQLNMLSYFIKEI